MKVAFVIQRYGLEVNGGSELLCRLVAEHLANKIEIEVLTTCAKDYITWKNAYPSGNDAVNGIPVKRFPVKEERNIKKFNRLSNKLLKKKNLTKKEEINWVNKQGPNCPKLLDFIKDNKDNYDRFIFFTYLYFPTVLGLPLVADKSLLVATAHDEPPIYLSIYQPVFKTPRAMIYNTPEEKEFVNKLFGNQSITSDIIATGINLPQNISPKDFKDKFNLDKYLLYAGRIEEGKGLDQLFSYFVQYTESSQKNIKLVLLGKQTMTIPDNPSIVHLGFVSEKDKFNAIAGSEVVIIPSSLESLSIISLEAWSQKKPILANAACPTLKGNCKRSGGGLYYNNFEEFKEKLNSLLNDKPLCQKLGENGYQYFENTYSWPIIKKKYLDLILDN